MSSEPALPEVMANAREDLGGNVAGTFSPDDWAQILARAADEVRASAKPPTEAWVDVIRTFHRERYWGFRPNYRAPKAAKPKPHEKNLGLSFIYYVSRSFLFTKVIVLYAGARWTAGYEPYWGWLFFGAIAFMVVSYARFVWIHGRGRSD